MHIRLIVGLLLLFSLSSHLIIGQQTSQPTGQPKTITIDTITSVPSETLPFHRPFFLKMIARKDNPVGISLFKLLRNKSLSQTVVEKTQARIEIYDDDGNFVKTDTIPKNFTPTKIDPSYFFTRKEGDKTYLYINFRDTIALQPNQQYTIAIFYRVHPDAPKVFRLLHTADSLATGPDSMRRKKALLIRQAVDEYNKIAEKGKVDQVYFGMYLINYPGKDSLKSAPITQIRPDGLIDKNFTWVHDRNNPSRLIASPTGIIEVDSLLSFYQKQIKPAYQAIDKLNKALADSLLRQAGLGISVPIASRFKDLLSLYLKYDTVASSKIRDLFTLDNNQALRSINQLNRLTGDTYLPVGKGLRPLLCDFCTLTESTDYAGRIKNLEATVGNIQRVQLLTQLLTSQIPSLSDLEKHLRMLVDQFTNNRANLQLVIKNSGKALEAIGQNGQFESTDFAGGDTYSFDFETRTKYSLVPEIGIFSNRLFSNSSNYLLLPYIGATINFTPLDRDVPYYLVRNKSVWQHLGLVLGYTLASVKDSTANPPRDNFFDKSALVTGLSYRFSNTVKAITGFTWLYKRSAETGMRSLSGLPFIGLSFDIDVKKYVADLFGAVTSLKGAPNPTTSTAKSTP